VHHFVGVIFLKLACPKFKRPIHDLKNVFDCQLNTKLQSRHLRSIHSQEMGSQRQWVPWSSQSPCTIHSAPKPKRCNVTHHEITMFT
jgi:hypothetical protein